MFHCTEQTPAELETIVLKAMEKNGSRGARCALDLAAEPGRFLSTVQIGITLIGILAGAYSGASLGEPVAQRLALLGMDPETARTVGFGVVIGSMPLMRGRGKKLAAQKQGRSSKPAAEAASPGEDEPTAAATSADDPMPGGED